jgi:predicted methyltransferase
MNKIIMTLAAIALVGCGQSSESPAPIDAAKDLAGEVVMSAPLAAVLANQSGEVKARYQYRHPQETLDFFGVKPGTVVVEALPGGGWYSKILLEYLGEDGALIGADYARAMYTNFDFASEEFMERKKTWVTDWTAQAETMAGDTGTAVDAFVFGSLPQEMHGSADTVLLIRALHNLARFEESGGYLSAALQDSFDVLRSGGIVGVVQHEARGDMPDDWANGNNGYLKKDFIVRTMESIGFEYMGSSPINQNERDQPTTDDAVWRLPPTLATSSDNAALREQMMAIGESNRMTLKFRKP